MRTDMHDTALQAVLDGTFVVADERADRLRLWVSRRSLGERTDGDRADAGLLLFEATLSGAAMTVHRLDPMPTNGLPSLYVEWTVKPEEGSADVRHALAIVRRAVAVEALLTANPVKSVAGVAFAAGDGTLAATPALGLAEISAEGRVSEPYDALRAIAQRVAGEADATPEPPDAAVQAALHRVGGALDDAQACLDRGELLASEHLGGQRFLRRSGRTLVMRRWEIEAVPSLVENPFPACDDSAWRLVEALPLTPVPMPDALAAALPELEASLALSPAAIVDRLVVRLRNGGTISGGPTTDQRWTLSYCDGGFRIAGTNSEWERTDDPISEADVRRMFATYRMFGLER